MPQAKNLKFSFNLKPMVQKLVDTSQYEIRESDLIYGDLMNTFHKE